MRSYKTVFALLFGLICLVFAGTSLTRETIKDYLLRKEISRLGEELDLSQKKGLKLADLLKEFSDTAWREERARRELNLKRPGESVIIIHDEKHGDVASAREIPDQPRESNVKKWVNYFFNND